VPPSVPRYFALVPAAGAGSRMGANTPKQYLEIAGRPLLYYALRALARETRIERIFVVVATGEVAFAQACVELLRGLEGREVRVLPCGGDTRAASVYNGLSALAGEIAPDDWVLVHDAARPCLTAGALTRLIDRLAEDAAGGLLAIPLADTLKRADSEQRVALTQPRAGLWQAQTPQMFRYATLTEALRRSGFEDVTDEASAVERMGLKPLLVAGEARNLKVTYPEDLELARLILEHEE